MTLPGFNAETSLYKTSVHYRLAGGSIQADSVMPQISIWCGTCFLDNTGACVRMCGRPWCTSFEPWLCTWIAPCDPSACPSPPPPPPVDCDKARAGCRANGGIVFDCHDLVPDRCAACPPCCFRCM